MAIIAGLLADAPDSVVAGPTTAISQAADALEAANAAHVQAIGAVQIAYGQDLTARGDWIRQYEKVYGELVARVLGSAARSCEAAARTQGRWRICPERLPRP
ncbi:MAG: hypothetical protein CSA24_00680 [Deltaproteobacteria bacterium]|nr:MAG: hypothetical protein CSA24_00680 [Deltaproteobacteria bacterium]